jgi:hypothetical protein
MLVCVFLCTFCTRDRGCSVHPVFPAPSCFEGKDFAVKPRTHRVAGTRRCVSTRHCQERSCPPKPAFGRRRMRPSNPFFLYAAPSIASRSLSSGARSRDPFARNDGVRAGCLAPLDVDACVAIKSHCAAHKLQNQPLRKPHWHFHRLLCIGAAGTGFGAGLLRALIRISREETCAK